MAVANNIATTEFFSTSGSGIRNYPSINTNYFDLSTASSNSNISIIKNTLGFDYAATNTLPSNYYKADYDFHFYSTSDFLTPTIASDQYWFISNRGNTGSWLHHHDWFATHEPVKSGVDYLKVRSEISHTSEKISTAASKYHTFWNISFVFEILDSDDSPSYHTHFSDTPIFEFRMHNSGGTHVGTNFNTERIKFTITAYDQTSFDSYQFFE